MAVMFTDRRGPIENADADAAYALAVKLARGTGKPVNVYRRSEFARYDYLVTSEPAPNEGWHPINRALPPS